MWSLPTDRIDSIQFQNMFFRVGNEAEAAAAETRLTSTKSGKAG